MMNQNGSYDCTHCILMNRNGSYDFTHHHTCRTSTQPERRCMPRAQPSARRDVAAVAFGATAIAIALLLLLLLLLWLLLMLWW